MPAKPVPVPAKPVINAVAGNRAVAISWEKPADNGSPIIGYKLRVLQGGNNIWGSPFNIGADSTSYKVEGLTNGTEYSFELVAINAGGNSITATENVTPILQAPAEPVLTIVQGAEKLTIRWDNIQGDDLYMGAHMIVTDSEGNVVVNQDIELDRKFYIVNGLKSNSNHTINFRVSNGVGSTEVEVVARTTESEPEPEPVIKDNAVSGGSSSNSAVVVRDKNNQSSTQNILIFPVDKNIFVDSTVIDNTAIIDVTADQIKKGVGNINIAKDNNNTTQKGIAVGIVINTPKAEANSIIANIATEAIDGVINANVEQFVLAFRTLEISFKSTALRNIQNNIDTDVAIKVEKIDSSTLAEEAKQLIGERPVYNFEVIGAEGKAVTNFAEGSISLAIPYTLGSDEKAENVIGYNIDADGSTEQISNAYYDEANEVLIVETNALAQFAVGYKAEEAINITFTDTENHWAKDAIDFVVAKGLLSGMGNGKFSPDTGMTRGMFVTALGRLAGIDTASYTTNTFSDVATTQYYAPYIAWASEKGIVKGVSATSFEPNTNITREQMAVIMYNYSKAMGYTIPQSYAEVSFVDSTDIASWSSEAVKAMQRAGVISGKNGNRFDPQGTATRAEVSSLLKCYVELVVDKAIAK